MSIAQEFFSPYAAPLVTSSLAQYLINLDAEKHDPVATNLLCAVSAWAYSNEDTFRRMLSHRALIPTELVSIELTNESLFLDTTATIIRHGNLGILCFRGTGPTNLIDWMTDLSVQPDPFQSIGYVHGGIYRGVLSLWPRIRQFLLASVTGESLEDVQIVEQEKFGSATRGLGSEELLRLASKLVLLREELKENSEELRRFEGLLGLEDILRLSARLLLGKDLTHAESELLKLIWQRDQEGLRERKEKNKLEALYVTGHSLGGALAALAAMSLDQDPVLGKRLRGVYTFGQPMVGDPTFANECEKVIGNKVFRHVYRRDIVPRFPPITTGCFKHFGREYTSTSTGWMYRSDPMNQAFTFAVSTAIGGAAWTMQQFPILRGIRMPFSWGDHSPINYLRTSQMTPPGLELNPWLSRPHG